MNVRINILLVWALLVLTACSNNSKTETTAIEESAVTSEDTISTTTTEPAGNVNFDQMELISRQVFAIVLPQGEQSEDIEEIVIGKCTPSFINALKRANDFDDGSLAWWTLRTMEQEGPDSESSIIAVTPDGNNAVIVEYSDMGHKASTRLEFVKEGDDYKINSARVTFNGKNRTIK